MRFVERLFTFSASISSVCNKFKQKQREFIIFSRRRKLIKESNGDRKLDPLITKTHIRLPIDEIIRIQVYCVVVRFIAVVRYSDDAETKEGSNRRVIEDIGLTAHLQLVQQPGDGTHSLHCACTRPYSDTTAKQLNKRASLPGKSYRYRTGFSDGTGPAIVPTVMPLSLFFSFFLLHLLLFNDDWSIWNTSMRSHKLSQLYSRHILLLMHSSDSD